MNKFLTMTAADHDLEQYLLQAQAGAVERDIDEADHALGKVDQYIEQTVDYFVKMDIQPIHDLESRKMTRGQFLELVAAYIQQYDALTEEEMDQVMEGFQKFMWSYDVISGLIDDPDVSDIRCLSPWEVRYKKFGHRYQADVRFRNPDHYAQFVRRIGTKNQVGVTDQNAIQSFTDTTSHPDFILRFDISTKYVNSSQFDIVHIRKIPKRKKGILALIEEGLLSKAQAAYLIETVRNKGSLLFCGKGGSGKTTLMNALIDYVDDQVSIECIQENEELFSKVHPEMVCQHVVANKGEGKIRYELKDLARNSLVSDIDMFIIGEIKGEEARYLFTATNTGAFYMASIHAARASEALVRLADFIKYASDYSQEEILKMMSANTDAIVFLSDYNVKEILEVEGYDAQKKEVKYKKVEREGEACISH